MTIDLYVNEKSGKHTIQHDLNFANEMYEAKHTIVFKNPSSALLNILKETGPVPGEENGRKKDSEKKRKRPTGNVDIEKLAENLVKLDEESLLQVVQMIHDNKTPDTYTKNDVEREFTIPPASATYTGVHFTLPFRSRDRTNLVFQIQRASSTLIFTPFRIILPRCSGITPINRLTCSNPLWHWCI